MMRRRSWILATLALAAGPVVGAGLALHQPRQPDVWGPLSSYAVVQSLDAPELTLVDIARDRVAGVIDLAEPADQLLVSASAKRIVFSNRASRRISVYDLRTKSVEASLPLPFPPVLLLLNPDGNLVAAADPESGGVALISLKYNRVVSVLAGISGAAHLSFSYDSQTLLAHDPTSRSVTRIDVATGAISTEGPLGAPSGGLPPEMAALTCLPGGLNCVAADMGGSLSVLDMREGRVRNLPLGPAPARPYASQEGSHLIVPDLAEPRLSIISTAGFDVEARLPGARGVASVSTTYFDPAAWVVSTAEDRALAIDLETRTQVAEIPLPGKPGPGIITEDGRKLYIALSDRDSIAVIDVFGRKLLTTIKGVGKRPWTVRLALEDGLCH